MQMALYATLAQPAHAVHVVTSNHTLQVIEETHTHYGTRLEVSSYLSPAAACRDGI